MVLLKKGACAIPLELVCQCQLGIQERSHQQLWSRSWANWNSGHYTEVCLHYREMFNSVPVEPCWSVFQSSSSGKTNLYCEPLKHLLFRKRDIRRTLTQSVILKRILCNKTTVNLYNKQIYVIPLVDKKREFLLRWKILVPNYSNDDTLRSYFVICRFSQG